MVLLPIADLSILSIVYQSVAHHDPGISSALRISEV